MSAEIFYSVCKVLIGVVGSTLKAKDLLPKVANTFILE